LVSAQVILLVIGVIGFFATGGIGNDIKEKTKSGMEGKEA
jgi:hypothetical protein